MRLTFKVIKKENSYKDKTDLSFEVYKKCKLWKFTVWRGIYDSEYPPETHEDVERLIDSHCRYARTIVTETEIQKVF